MNSCGFMLALITNTMFSVLSEISKESFYVHYSHEEVKQDTIKLISKEKLYPVGYNSMTLWWNSE